MKIQLLKWGRVGVIVVAGHVATMAIQAHVVESCEGPVALLELRQRCKPWKWDLPAGAW